MLDSNRIKKQSGIIGTSNGIDQVLEMICQVSPVDISVLITGESGTGKEVVAKQSIGLAKEIMILWWL